MGVIEGPPVPEYLPVRSTSYIVRHRTGVIGGLDRPGPPLCLHNSARRGRDRVVLTLTNADAHDRERCGGGGGRERVEQAKAPVTHRYRCCCSGGGTGGGAGIVGTIPLPTITTESVSTAWPASPSPGRDHEPGQSIPAAPPVSGRPARGGARPVLRRPVCRNLCRSDRRSTFSSLESRSFDSPWGYLYSRILRVLRGIRLFSFPPAPLCRRLPAGATSGFDVDG
jgi:hypothetical protein